MESLDHRTENRSHDRIELRSEKVRDIIGHVPATLFMWSTVVLLIVTAMAVAILLCFPLPFF